jgi:hypothetical protein
VSSTTPEIVSLCWAEPIAQVRAMVANSLIDEHTKEPRNGRTLSDLFSFPLELKM